MTPHSPPIPRTFEPSPGRIIDAERTASPSDPTSPQTRARAALAALRPRIERKEAQAVRALNQIDRDSAERHLEVLYAEENRLWPIAYPAIVDGDERVFVGVYCRYCQRGPLGRHQAFYGTGICAVCIAKFGGGGGDAPPPAPGPTY